MPIDKKCPKCGSDYRARWPIVFACGTIQFEDGSIYQNDSCKLILVRKISQDICDLWHKEDLHWSEATGFYRTVNIPEKLIELMKGLIGNAET